MRVVIAEDLFLLRDGLTRMLEAHGFEISAAVDNGTDLLAAVTSAPPDVAVVDVRLPPTFTDEGLRAALAARRAVPGLPVLVLSQYVEQLYARELLAGGSGGLGYLLKDRVFDSAQFVDAIRRVAAGGTAMDPEVIDRLLLRNSGDNAIGALSRREGEVLGLMAEGRTNAAIAQRLVITERAVAKHTASIFLRLGLQPSDDDNRRVLAVLTYLSAEQPAASGECQTWLRACQHMRLGSFTITPDGPFSLAEAATFGFGQRAGGDWDGVMRLAFCLDGYAGQVAAEVRQDGASPASQALPTPGRCAAWPTGRPPPTWAGCAPRSRGCCRSITTAGSSAASGSATRSSGGSRRRRPGSGRRCSIRRTRPRSGAC